MTELQLDGQRVRIDDRGQHTTSAPALLMIHGAGHDHAAWDGVATSLVDAGLRCIAPDLPGHGASTGAPLPDIDAMADWVLALADALELAEFALVGHSMGSLVALASAAGAPDRVTRLILVGSVAPMPVAPFVLDAARDNPAYAHELINKFSFAPPEVHGEARHRLLTQGNTLRMQRQAPATLLVDMLACNAWQGGLQAAARVHCPTLLACGALDRMTPPDAAKPLLAALQSGKGGAQMIVVPGTGHAMMDEAPAELSKAIRGHCLAQYR